METKKQQGSNDQIEIDLGQIFHIFLSKWWLVVGIAVVCAVLTFLGVKFFVTPQFTSTTSIMILNKTSDASTVTSSDLSASTTLSKDYVEIATSTTVIEEVIENLGLDLTTKELKSKISASTVSDTRIIEISVTDPSPEEAQRIANELAQVVQHRTSEIMNIENIVSVVDEADLPLVKSSPSTGKYTAIAFILAFLIVWLILVIVVLLDDSIKTSDDVEKYLGVSCLAVIPDFIPEECMVDADPPATRSLKAESKPKQKEAPKVKPAPVQKPKAETEAKNDEIDNLLNIEFDEYVFEDVSDGTKEDTSDKKADAAKSTQDVQTEKKPSKKISRVSGDNIVHGRN